MLLPSRNFGRTKLELPNLILILLVEESLFVGFENDLVGEAVLFWFLNEGDSLVSNGPKMLEEVHVVLFLRHVEHGVGEDKSPCPPNPTHAVNNNGPASGVGVRTPVLSDEVEELLRVIGNPHVRPGGEVVVDKDSGRTAL
jgi:hypothetical protein